MEKIENKNIRTLSIAFLLVLASLLTYYFQHVLKNDRLYTHFFYIPIILSCLWWRRKGLVVTGVLIFMLLAGQIIVLENQLLPEDYIRAFMLAFISFITVGLSESLAGARKKLSESEVRYRTIFENTGTPMMIIEPDTTISLVNSEFENLSGYSKFEIENKKSWTEFVAGEQVDRMTGFHRNRRLNGVKAPKKYTFTFVTRKKELRDILINIDVIPGTDKSVASFSDITELQKTLKKQKELQAELSSALAKVLSGFIPICAGCKKIRDEQNNWIQIESFISDKTEADFSHGICPQCAKNLYADFFTEEKEPEFA